MEISWKGLLVKKKLLCVSWTVTGKVSDVIRTEESNKPKLHFDYDAMGQRISKTVTNKNVTMGDKFVTTYYVRNPQGNVMAVYEKKEDAAGAGQFQLKERHLYGINRLGMVSQNVTLAQFDNSNVTNGTDPTTPQAGDTHYELTNHLGNVMAVISDTTSTTSEPTVVSLSDYYPFGMEMPRRNYSNGEYRYGFNGKEKDDANGIHLDFGARIYDSRIGRFLSVDPKVSNTMASYSFAGNNPIGCIDYEGLFSVKYTEGSEYLENNEPFNLVLKHIHLMLEANNAIVEEISKQTGFSAEGIMGDMVFGQGKVITVKPYEKTSSSTGKAIAYGGSGEGIVLASEVVQQLFDAAEAYKNAKASQKAEALKVYESTAFAVAQLILHEYTHEKDGELNKNEDTGEYIITDGIPGDMGKQNSASIFGHRGMDVEAAIWGVLDDEIKLKEQGEPLYTKFMVGGGGNYEDTSTWPKTMKSYPDSHMDIRGVNFRLHTDGKSTSNGTCYNGAKNDKLREDYAGFVEAVTGR